MKFISVVALLAPVVVAMPVGEAWITLIKEQCPKMSEQCIDAAKEAHKVLYSDVSHIIQAMPACTPAYNECIQQISGAPVDLPTPQPGGGDKQLVTCIRNISPDHVKFFLDNDKASTPIPSSQNCVLRELHRVAHVELGPLA